MIAGFYGALAMGNLEEARKIGHFLTPADKRRIVNHIPDKGTGLLYKWVWNYDAWLYKGCNGWVVQDRCNSEVGCVFFFALPIYGYKHMLTISSLLEAPGTEIL